MFIVSDNTDDTSSNSNKAMVSVGASNNEGNNSNDAIIWLVSKLVDRVFDLVLHSDNGMF